MKTQPQYLVRQKRTPPSKKPRVASPPQAGPSSGSGSHTALGLLEFTPGGLTRSYHGSIYQVAVHLALMLWATKEDYKFEVAVEYEELGGKFDDVIMKFKDKSQEQHGYFIQVKSIQSKITKPALFQKKNKKTESGFDLVKYFLSVYYLNIDYKGLKFIIFTNSEIDQSLISSNFVKRSNNDEFIKFLGGQDTTYSINIDDEIVKQFKEIIENKK